MPYEDPTPYEEIPDDLADELMARHVEVQTLADLLGTDHQRGTAIPALYNMWFRFIQNPSTVSVESYKRMVDTDETIGSGVDFLISCLVARLGAYQHKNPDITKFVTRVLTEIQGGFPGAAKEILSACWTGFSSSEVVWANKSIGFVPQKIVTLPPTTVLYEVDRVGDLKDDGVLQYQKNFTAANTAFGQGYGAGLGAGVGANGFHEGRPDPFARYGDMAFPVRAGNMFNYMAIRIPKMKCINFAWNGPGRFGNPYGRSMLRRCYNWWVTKWAGVQMMSTAMDRKGTPLTVVFADMAATMLKDPSKAGSSEKKGKGDMESAIAAAVRAFSNVSNSSTIVLPGKKGQTYDIEQIANDGNIEGFIAALQFFNTMMLRGLLIPSLIFTSGDGSGSYALGETHAKTFDKLLDSYLTDLIWQLLDQFIRQIIAYNFPQEMWIEDGYGDFAKRELTMDERQKEMEVFAGGIDKGIIDTDDLADLNKMREAIGFEPRSTPIPKPMLGVMNGFPGEDETDPADDGDPSESTAPGDGRGSVREQPGRAAKPASPPAQEADAS